MVAVLAFACLALLTLAAVAVWSCRAKSAELAEFRRERDEIEAASRHCGVTGLANRQLAFEWLEAALALDTARPAVVRVAFVPFAEGMAREGKLARMVAEILENAASGTTLVGRMAPGEYLLALDGAAGSAALVTTARAVCTALSQLTSDCQRLRVGVALAVGGDTPASLIERAEMALHLCPAADPVALAFSDLELREEVDSRTLAAAELGEAIEQGRIEPFFQPFVELGSGHVLGFEVLARWRDEEGHVHMPGEFLPLAEESGLVGPMYFALLRASAGEARQWPPEWTFALNLSAQQFRDEGLVENTMRTLLDAGIGPGRLEIEIAEQALGSDLELALSVVRAFRDRGIRVVLDNFGAGGLQLTELARFPFDRIKVDHAAICPDDAEPGVALGLIAAAGRHLGMPVLVQGIETYASAEAAQVNGCAIGQGFLFGRPGRRTECFRLEGALAPGGPTHHKAA